MYLDSIPFITGGGWWWCFFIFSFLFFLHKYYYIHMVFLFFLCNDLSHSATPYPEWRSKAIKRSPSLRKVNVARAQSRRQPPDGSMCHLLLKLIQLHGQFSTALTWGLGRGGGECGEVEEGNLKVQRWLASGT